MLKLFRYITNLGVSDSQSLELNKGVRIMNQMSIVTVFMIIVMFIYSLYYDLKSISIVTVILFAIMLIPLLLNSDHHKLKLPLQ